MSAASDHLRLCSWNVHLGLQLDRLQASLQAVEHFQDLDLLLLQELSMRGHRPNAEAIAHTLGPDYRALQRNVDRFHGRVRGLGLVWNSSRFELTQARMLALPHLHHAELRRRHRDWLRPLRLRPRSSLMVEGHAAGQSLRVYVVHLSPIGFMFQLEQMATILRDAAHRPGCDLLVVAGDFNSLRMDRRKWAAWFAARESEGWANASREVEWTFQSAALPMRQKLDHALVRSREVIACTSRCPELPGSDHLPLFFDIRR
jgi:endonuclease/exonuclease/phosphatase family metal-dependent hydrolase